MKKGKRKKNYKLAGGEIRGSLYTYIPDTTVCIKKIFFCVNNNKFTYFMGKVKLFYYGY